MMFPIAWAVIDGGCEIARCPDREKADRIVDALTKSGMTEEQYLLTVLAEECAEVAHRCAKAIRFGAKEVQPGQSLDNRERIEAELGDLMGVVGMLKLEPRRANVTSKAARVIAYATLSRERGMLR